MSFLAKLRLCAIIWCAETPADWRWLRDYCDRQAANALMRAILAAIAADEAECARQDAIEAERRQVAAGVRTTGAAERLVRQARALVNNSKL